MALVYGYLCDMNNIYIPNVMRKYMKNGKSYLIDCSEMTPREYIEYTDSIDYCYFIDDEYVIIGEAILFDDDSGVNLDYIKDVFNYKSYIEDAIYKLTRQTINADTQCFFYSIGEEEL